MEITISVLNYSQLFELIYGNGGEPKDRTVFDRIRYFSSHDFGWAYRDMKLFYIVMSLDEKIIGMVKCAYYDYDAHSKIDYGVSFFSIDLQYRNLGYSRLMADKLFEYAKENNLEISTSHYSFLGKLKLQKLFLEYSAKHSVVFYDKKETDALHDYSDAYDKNLIHHDEKARFELLCMQGVDIVLTENPEYKIPVKKNSFNFLNRIKAIF